MASRKLLLLPGDGLLRALAAASVRARPLTADGQALAVADALVAPDLDLALNVVLDIAPEVTLDGQVGVDVGPDAVDLLLGQVGDLDVRIEVDGGVSPANAYKVIDAGANALVAGSAVFNSDDYAKAIAGIKASKAPK